MAGKKLIIWVFIILISMMSIYAWEDCHMDGYQNCANETNSFDNGTNILSTTIAFTVLDERGMEYSQFMNSSFAVGGLYAHVYINDGDELWYTPNLKSWSDACVSDYCNGTLLNASGYYQMADIGDEFIDCIGFTSVFLHPTGYVWASTGHLKSSENSCCHIRIVECSVDSDCVMSNEHCRQNGILWVNWSCQPKECELNQYKCDGWKGSSFYGCTDNVWNSIGTDPLSPNCTGRENSTWFLISETKTLDIVDIEGVGNIPLRPNYLGEESPVDERYMKSDLALIAVDATGTFMASVVYYLPVLIIVILIGVFVAWYSNKR